MTTIQILYLAVAIVTAISVIVGIVASMKRRNSSNELPWEKPAAGPALESDFSTPIDADAVEYSSVPSSAGNGVEIPESVPSRMQRLRARLARGGGLGKALLGILSRGDLSVSDWEEIEETLLMADVGLDATTEIMTTLKEQAKVLGTSDASLMQKVLRAQLLKLVDPAMDRSLALSPASAAGKHTIESNADSEGTVESSANMAVRDSSDDATDTVPSAILMVGVNGTGKTTTTGKLARLMVAEGRSVVLGAADTFRAAAADQLQTWGERVGVPVVRSDKEGADPASVAFEAVKTAAQQGTDVVIVDTAGRLQNKAGLMDELGKIKRVMEKQAPVSEVLLVLDATTGQNGMQQAKVFAEVTGLTGIVLTKLDGTAKGGIVISVQRELGVPVKFVGLGEGVDDLAPFDPDGFVDSLLA